MLQVSWFKYTQKSSAKPAHPADGAAASTTSRKSGWKETQVVVRFWIITMLLCLIGLSSLKLR